MLLFIDIGGCLDDGMLHREVNQILFLVARDKAAHGALDLVGRVMRLRVTRQLFAPAARVGTERALEGLVSAVRGQVRIEQLVVGGCIVAVGALERFILWNRMSNTTLL